MGRAAHLLPAAFGAGRAMAVAMTWRETMILVAISALLSAAITAGIRFVMENLTF
jgi:hypothetical protein